MQSFLSLIALGASIGFFFGSRYDDSKAPSLTLVKPTSMRLTRQVREYMGGSLRGVMRTHTGVL